MILLNFLYDKYFSYQYRTIIIYSFTGLLNEKYHFESIWSPDKLKHYYHSEINNNCKFTRKTSGFHQVFFCFLHEVFTCYNIIWYTYTVMYFTLQIICSVNKDVKEILVFSNISASKFKGII